MHVRVLSSFMCKIVSVKYKVGSAWLPMVLSRVMRKINSVTYEVGSAKAEQA